MQLELSDEQTMLADGVARYLRQFADASARRAQTAEGGWSRDIWSHFAKQGLLALPFPETVGGLGGSTLDLIALAERFGEALLTEPYAASVVLAGGALSTAVGHTEAETLIARIISGDAIVALAHEEGHGSASAGAIAARARAAHGGFVLDGVKVLALAGDDAEAFVVSARIDDGVGLFLVDPVSVGLTVMPFVTIDGRGAARLRLEGVQVPETSLLRRDAHLALEGVFANAILYFAAEAVGAMASLCEVTRSYATTRQQFGVAIGSFQVIAHRLADMKIALTKARATLLHTAASVEEGQARPVDIAMLKAQMGRLGRSIAEAAVQTHGGIGMTDELSVGHYLKRLLVIEAIAGDSDSHLRLLGASMSGRPAGS